MALNQIRAGMIQMPHVDSCVTRAVSSNVCVLAVKAGEMLFMHHHLPYFLSTSSNTRVSEYFPILLNSCHSFLALPAQP